MSKYKFAVKRSKPSKKSIGKAFKRVTLGKKIKARDVSRAISKARKSPGGIPRVDQVARLFTGGGPPSARQSAAAQAQIRKREDEFYRRLDGGTRDQRYVSARMPGIESKSKSKQSRSSAPSYDMGTSYMDQMVYDFQQEREEMMARYEQMMIEQARQAEEQRKQMEAAMRAQAQNAYSATLQPTLQIQGAGETPKLSGIEQFKRRAGSQFGTASPYTGLAKIKSGMVNV